MPTYKNGQVPRSAMKAFRNTGKYGHPDFVNRLDQAFTAVQREMGVTLYISSGQDIVRDYAGQVYWKNYWTGIGLPRNAAEPGFSNHGLGVCADISGLGSRGTSKWNGVAAIFARYNLRFVVQSESWHVQDMNINVSGNVVTIDTPAAVSGYSGNPYFPAIELFKIVQSNYNFIGYHLDVDGRVGPKTTEAVRDFQKKHHLVVDGIHGKGTNQALDDAVNAKHRADKAAADKAAANKPKPLSEVVKDQQRRLNVWTAATPPLAVDGIPGPRFEQATKVFQKAHGLSVDGKVGAKTWAALQKNPPKAPAALAKPKTLSEVVKDQQRRLNVWGAMTPPLKVDGIPGPKFEQATQIFQRAHGLTVDGKIGAKTWAMLQKNPPKH